MNFIISRAGGFLLFIKNWFAKSTSKISFGKVFPNYNLLLVLIMALVMSAFVHLLQQKRISNYKSSYNTVQVENQELNGAYLGAMSQLDSFFLQTNLLFTENSKLVVENDKLKTELEFSPIEKIVWMTKTDTVRDIEKIYLDQGEEIHLHVDTVYKIPTEGIFKTTYNNYQISYGEQGQLMLKSVAYAPVTITQNWYKKWLFGRKRYRHKIESPNTNIIFKDIKFIKGNRVFNE